jgi:hypothetical protein
MKLLRYDLEISENRSKFGEYVRYDDIEEFLASQKKYEKDVVLLLEYVKSLSVPYEVGETIIRLENLLKNETLQS